MDEVVCESGPEQALELQERSSRLKGLATMADADMEKFKRVVEERSQLNNPPHARGGGMEKWDRMGTSKL